MSPLAFVFGCRDPNSKYARDGAFVAVCVRGKTDIVLAHFQNGMDYIGHTESIPYAIKEYNSFLERGWLVMDVNDLDKTAINKSDIDEHTIIIPDHLM